MRIRPLLLVLVLIFSACGDTGGDEGDSREENGAQSEEAQELEEVVEEAVEEEGVDLSDAAAEALANTAIEYGLGAEALIEYGEDIALSITDLNDYWSVILPELYGIEHVAPENFFPYSGSIDPPMCGGEVLEEGNAFYCFTDDFVAWDDTGLMFPYFAEIGDFAIAFIIAHEWGHKIQELVGAQADFGIQYELQADCYAGAWARDADDRGLLEKGDIDEAFYGLAEAADLRGTPWTDPLAHGKPRERIGAFLIGYEDGVYECTIFTD